MASPTHPPAENNERPKLGEAPQTGRGKGFVLQDPGRPAGLAPAGPECRGAVGGKEDQNLLLGVVSLLHLGHTSHSLRATLADSDLDSGQSVGPVGTAHCTTTGMPCVNSCVCYSEPQSGGPNSAE